MAVQRCTGAHDRPLPWGGLELDAGPDTRRALPHRQQADVPTLGPTGHLAESRGDVESAAVIDDLHLHQASGDVVDHRDPHQ